MSFAFIEKKDSTIYKSAIIDKCAWINNNVEIHSNTVVRGRGVGYKKSENGQLEKFPHIVGVIIEDNVEIWTLLEIQ